MSLPSFSLLLPCGPHVALLSYWDDSAGPLEKKGVLSLLEAGVGEVVFPEVLDQVRWPVHPLRSS